MIVVRKLLTVLGYKIDDANLKRYDAQLKNTTRSIGSLTDVARGAALAVAGIFGGKLAGDIVSANVEFEKLIARLTTLEGAKAPDVFKQLQKFAAETPAELNDVVDSYIRLKAAGFEVNDEVLRALGDLGATSNKTFGEVTEIILSANRGLGNMVDNLAGLQARSEGGVLKLTNSMTGLVQSVEAGDTKGLLSFFLAAGRAPQVAGGMDRLAVTLGGLMSKLSDAVQEFYRVIGQSGAADALRETLLLLGEIVEGAAPAAGATLGQKIAAGIAVVNDGLRWVRDNLALLGQAFQTAGRVARIALFPVLWQLLLLQDLLRALRGESSLFGDLFGGQLEALGAKLQTVAQEVIGVASAAWEELQPAVEVLLDAFGELGAVIFEDLGRGDDTINGIADAVRLLANLLIVGIRQSLPTLKLLLGGLADAVRLLTNAWPVISWVLARTWDALKLVAAVIVGPTLAAMGLLFLAFTKLGPILEFLWGLVKRAFWSIAEVMALIALVIFGPLLAALGLAAIAVMGWMKVWARYVEQIKAVLRGIALVIGGIAVVLLGPTLLAIGLVAAALYGIYRLIMWAWPVLRVILAMVVFSILTLVALLLGPTLLAIMGVIAAFFLLSKAVEMFQALMRAVGEVIGAAIGGGVDAAKAKLDELLQKGKQVIGALAGLLPGGLGASLGLTGGAPGAAQAGAQAGAPGAQRAAATSQENTVNAGGLTVNIQGNANMAPGEIANAAQAGTQQGLRDFAANLAGGLI